MVDNTITDGKRIAQLLASEVTGLDERLLGAVSVTGADPDSAPTQSGTEAYTVVAGDDPVGTVSMYPESATLTFERAVSWPDDQRPALLDESDDVLVVSSGAGVKRAVDAIRLWLRLQRADETDTES